MSADLVVGNAGQTPVKHKTKGKRHGHQQNSTNLSNFRAVPLFAETALRRASTPSLPMVFLLRLRERKDERKSEWMKTRATKTMTDADQPRSSDQLSPGHPVRQRERQRAREREREKEKEREIEREGKRERKRDRERTNERERRNESKRAREIEKER
jgi:hypothetical protein